MSSTMGNGTKLIVLLAWICLHGHTTTTLAFNSASLVPIRSHVVAPANLLKKKENAVVPSSNLIFEKHRSCWKEEEDLSSSSSTTTTTKLLASNNINNNEDFEGDKEEQVGDKNRKRQRISQAMKQMKSVLSIKKKFRIKCFALAFAFANFYGVINPRIAQAKSAIIAEKMPQDPYKMAVQKDNENKQREHGIKMKAISDERERIVKTEGEAAAKKYDKEIAEEEIKQEQDKKAAIIKLQNELLDQGICPYTDLEGTRQILLLNKGMNVAGIRGSKWGTEEGLKKYKMEESTWFKQTEQRNLLRLIVQDLRNREIDPVVYFRENKRKTQQILQIDGFQAIELAKTFEANLKKYGQITTPLEGETSALEQMQARMDPKAQKKKAAQEKAEAKNIAKQEKLEAKRIAAELKLEAKRIAAEEKAEQKELAKKTEVEQKAVAAATSVGAASTAAGETMTDVTQNVEGAVEGQLEIDSTLTDSTTTETNLALVNGDDNTSENVPSTTVSRGAAFLDKISKNGPTIIKVSAITIGIGGGGGYGLKVYRDKAAADEEERQKQFRMIMGDSLNDKKTDDDDDDDGTDSDFFDNEDDDTSTGTQKETKQTESKETKAPSPATEAPSPPRKKRRKGLKSVFSKKNKNNRETDILVLVGDGAKNSEFSTLLAKTVTFGAPGRFPSVTALPGEMQMESFELEAAKSQLVESREKAGLTMEESAEVFANIVNCMLIDIVDLASSTLKEKDDKIKIEAINVVVDFMNHAASLYDAVADGIVIKPVTYGGDLSKSKLEQMYSVYAVSSMMTSMTDESSGSRIELLQDVFQINAKKAEGLMMKSMQKNMMNMMKSGEGMEGMEDMLKEMGGMEGMEGMAGMPGLEGMMGGDGEGPSPEELKQMLLSLKEMKDSGAIPPEELETVKQQFKEAFGSGVDDVIKEGEDGGISTEDKELLDLMKSILG